MSEQEARHRAWLGTRGARAAFWTLVLLVSSAVYAPFLANDKPYYVRAVDVRAVRQASDTLGVLVDEWQRAKDGHESKAKLAAAAQAVRLRLDTLERYVAPRSGLRLDDAPLRAALDEDESWTDKERGDALALTSVHGYATALADEVRAALQSESSEVFRAAPSWPLFESLAWTDWLIALLWPVLASSLLVRRRSDTIVKACGAALGLAVLASWMFTPAPGLSTRSIKSALTAREMLAESVVFAPVPYGYDETNLSEALRPPTWCDAAEMDARGRYVRGPRANAAGAQAPTTRPVEVRVGEPTLNCSQRHVLGVDSLGRDVLTRLLWGGRVSLSVAFGAVALMLLVGVTLGLLAGYRRGAFDALFLLGVQTLQSFPSFFLILVAVALLPTRGVHPQLATVLVIGLVSWTGVARLVRAEVLLLRELDFVLAARALGLSHARVLFAHIAPNAAPPVLVAAAFSVASAILIESATSFLGIGVKPPMPSWGAVLRESSAVEHWWILVFPGVAVFATVACCNALGDALRDALELREVDA